MSLRQFALRLAFALLPVFLLSACDARRPAEFRNTDISGASFGQGFSLRDHHGKLRSLSDFRGQAVLMFFGYTRCPDVCPTALARYAEVMKLLGEDAARVQVLFVTLDPARDSQAQLASYVPWFHPSFVGLYGDEAATAAVAQEFKVYFARKEGEGALGYVLDHTAGTYVFDPAGRIKIGRAHV